MLQHLQRIIWPTPWLHCFCKLLGIYLGLGWGQQLVSSTSPASNPVSVIWVYLLLQTLCQNIDAALSLQLDDFYFLALSKWVTEKISYLWNLFCFPFLPTEINLFLTYFSFYLSISEERLAKTLQLRFSFLFSWWHMKCLTMNWTVLAITLLTSS